MKELFIFPFNGNGLEALNCLTEEYRFIGFIDDTPSKQGKHDLGFEVFSRAVIKDFPEAQILAVPGSPQTFIQRHEHIASLQLPIERFATIIHPRASISPISRIGYNVLIMAGVVLTSNCTIGNHVCILPNTVVHHDSVIGDYTLVGSNVTVAGYTTIGKNCYVGSGTSIINGIVIGDYTLIGMGSNVIKSIPANSKIVGNPARAI